MVYLGPGAIIFSVRTDTASFTVRREARLGTSYWYAYRKHQGKLTSVYIGKAKDVTLPRLDAIADMLARRDGEAIIMPTSPEGLDRETKPGFDLTPPLPLPSALTPIVDRVEEVQAVTALLRRPDVRLVTLVGAGGIGKTRIALEVAAQLHANFEDGVYFVPLDEVWDADVALVTLARAIGLSPDGYTPVTELVKDCLQQKQALLILDNLEQVPAAGPLLADVLSACPDLKMLLTSREVMHLCGEYPFVVGPLSFPNPADLPALDELLSYPAIELFVLRARAMWTNLPLDEASMQAIARICARLEGLPLAIELAAARVKLLSPQALLERLEHSLSVLTQGGLDRPARQQTLRATLDWSHELLSRDEQAVLRRLGVFAGSCELEAAEAICGDPGDMSASLLDLFSSLIDKSLLLTVNSSTPRPRVRLSETVREYALESLVASGELEAIEEAHASYYLSLALKVAPELDQRRQDSWLEQLDYEDRNFGAALNFLLSRRDRERAVGLTGALGRYWYERGRMSEGLTWTEQALALRTDGAAMSQDRKALFAAGLFAIHLDQGERARAWLQESINICEAMADHAGLAISSYILSLSFLLKGNLTEAQSLGDRLTALARNSFDPWVLGTTEATAGTLSLYTGDFSRASVRLQRSAALFREAGDFYLNDLTLLLAADAQAGTGDRAQAIAVLDDKVRALEARHLAWPAGYVLCAYGEFALRRGDWSRARLLLEQSLNLFSRLRDARGVARACLFLAQAALYQQDYITAIATASRCIKTAEAAGATATVIGCLEELADAAVRRGKAGWAAQLWGAGARQRQATPAQHCPVQPVDRAQLIETARETLGPKTFAAAWDDGRALPLEQLLSVDNIANSVREHSVRVTHRPGGLTPRELDVLLLVADGLSNNEIAERLVITPATVVSYLNLIYKKLSVSSRTAAMRYAIDHQFTQPEAIHRSYNSY